MTKVVTLTAIVLMCLLCCQAVIAKGSPPTLAASVDRMDAVDQQTLSELPTAAVASDAALSPLQIELLCTRHPGSDASLLLVPCAEASSWQAAVAIAADPQMTDERAAPRALTWRRAAGQL